MTRVKSADRALLPKGMATLLPEATAVRRRLERAAFDVFRRWGYEEVITPLFEYLDVITPGLSPGLAEKAYTVADRGSGRLMVLRPDVTPQVARMAATLLSDAPRPMRLCYGANVFRYEDEHAGHEREIFQLGAELIGAPGPAADAEILALSMDVLKTFGLAGITVVIGHVGFFRGWLAATGASPERAAQLEEAVIKRDRTRLGELLAGGRTERLAGILDLVGDAGVLDQARDLVDHAESRRALETLKEVGAQARHYGLAKSLVIDLAEIRGREYYSGLIFELFADGVGYEVGRGGRYDELIGRFGPSSPSTGFAVHVERLQQALDRSPAERVYGAVDVMVSASSADRAAIRLVGELRSRNVRAALWVAPSPADVVEQARAMNVPWVTARASPATHVMLTDTATRRSRRTSLAAAIAAVLARRPG